MSLCALWLPLALCVAGGASPERGPLHPNSLSASRIDVRGARVVHAIEVQVLSLAEVLPGFDDDLDGRVTVDRIEADAGRIADYVIRGFRIRADGGAVLVPEGAPRVREAALREGVFGELEQYVRLDIDYTVAVAPRTLDLELDLFVDTSPEHRDLCVVVWNGVDLDAFDLPGRGQHRVAASVEALRRGRPAFGRYLSAVTGERVVLWELALLAAAIGVAGVRAGGSGARRRGVAEVASLAAAGAAGVAVAAGWWGVGAALGPRVHHFFELAGPLAVLYLGADGLFARVERGRVLEAMVFGAVLGAAVFVREVPELAREAATEFHPTSAVGDGVLGIVVGTVVVVLGAGLPTVLAGRWAARVVGTVALGVGVIVFAQRVL